MYLAWSGGKDAALALARRRPDGLLTTVNAGRDRSSMHGVRRGVVRAQADALGLPVRFVDLPDGVSNETYRERFRDGLDRHGVEQLAFADINLEDVRSYRESLLCDTGVEGVWPVWGEPTDALAREFVEAFEAVVVCVDCDALGPSFVGRSFDGDFLADLPAGVDPCGENGEFHTFVTDGPPFTSPVAVERGRTVDREVGGGTFRYQDLRLR
jgi:uncharacterized protein (TIGR00290 family)